MTTSGAPLRRADHPEPIGTSSMSKTTKAPIVRQTRHEYRDNAHGMIDEFCHDMRTRMMQAYDALTKEEIDQIDSRNPFLIIRAIAMHIGPDALAERFDCEAIEPHKRQIKAALKHHSYKSY